MRRYWPSSLMGECTEDELREVNAWLEESGENARELFRLEEIYHLGDWGILRIHKT